jgi:uncharacterized protein involved in exopolysaccharide biosynthesis
VIHDESPTSLRLAAKHLKTNTKVGAAKRSYVIQCTHEAYTPEDAQRNLQAIVQAFVQRHNEFYAPKSGNLKSRRDDELELLRSKRQEYKDHRASICGIHDLQETLTIGAADDIACKHRIHELQARIAEHEKKVEQLTQSLEGLDEFHETYEQPMVENPDWALANKQYDQAILELDKLIVWDGLTEERERLEEKWSEKRDEAYERRESLQQLVPYGDPIEKLVPNETWSQLTLELGQARAALEGFHAELVVEQDREKEIARLLAQAHECEALHSELDADIADLEANVQNLRQLYNDELKMEETRQEGESNLKIMSAATLPTQKSGPGRMKLLGAGIGGGLFLGLFLAVLRQFLDRRVRYRETAERLLEVPVLAVVPETRALRQLRPDAAKGA